MKKHIIITIQYLEIGGAERSLIGFLNAIDYKRYAIDLFVYRHTGEFMSLIPNEVNLLSEIPKYTTLNRPIKTVLKEGYVDIVLGRLWAKKKAKAFAKKNRNSTQDDYSIFHYVAKYTTPLLPPIQSHKEYDLAISFLTPHQIVREKIRAKKKIAWIHTDYSSIKIDIEDEYPVWKSFDHIISISESVSKSFLQIFPTLSTKLFLMENILSSEFIRQQASSFDPVEMRRVGKEFVLCTIARFSYPKAIDRAVLIARRMLEKGVFFRWYVIGYGGDESIIRNLIDEHRLQNYFIILGKKENPYPYLNACDVYIQPSRYEGKAVTVREALILGKPVVITNFPTASHQLRDGLDGLIIPNSIEGAADELATILINPTSLEKIRQRIKNVEYGNEEEILKLDQLL